MLTRHRRVTSVTEVPALSLHNRLPASRTSRRETSSSNATRTQPHTVTAETRHSYATELLRRGVAVEVLAHLLGHSSIATTGDAYAHLKVEDARRALVAAGWLADQDGPR